MNSKMWPSAKKHTVAALLARSNMGQNPPTESSSPRAAHISLSSAVCDICGPFMETDEHEEMFMHEARMWLRDYINKNELSDSMSDILSFYDRNYTIREN